MGIMMSRRRLTRKKCAKKAKKVEKDELLIVTETKKEGEAAPKRHELKRKG